MSGTTSATNAGNYSVTLSLNNKFNYVWSDGTTTDKTIGWSIGPLSISGATIALGSSLTYNRNSQT